MTLRVVVADDHAQFRRAARSMLAASVDFQLVGEALSGEEAVLLARTLRPDLVLMDINMDGIGGIAAARSINETHPETATILVSTYREEDLPSDARTCGAAGYVHKAELAANVLTRLLRGRGSPPSRACESTSPTSDRA
jgi:two-component system, NarL family, invasion response regulator UvrY